MTPRRFLLDSNALLWLAIEPERISDTARKLFAEPATELAVSSASAWEVSIKVNANKLPGGRAVLASWDDLISDLRADTLDIGVGDAILAGELPWAHRDPFDRMIVAQALRHGYHVATSDATLLREAPVATVDTRR